MIKTKALSFFHITWLVFSLAEDIITILPINSSHLQPSNTYIFTSCYIAFLPIQLPIRTLTFCISTSSFLTLRNVLLSWLYLNITLNAAGKMMFPDCSFFILPLFFFFCFAFSHCEALFCNIRQKLYAFTSKAFCDLSLPTLSEPICCYDTDPVSNRFLPQWQPPRLTSSVLHCALWYFLSNCSHAERIFLQTPSK